jgi:hypothetical protein
VPISTAIVAGDLLERARTVCSAWTSRAALAAGLVVAGVLSFAPAPYADDPAEDAARRSLGERVRTNTARDAVLVAPPQLETLRIDSQRALAVDEKSHPLRGDEVLAWWETLQEARTAYDRTLASSVRHAALSRLITRSGATHVLMPVDDSLVEGVAAPVLRDGTWLLARANDITLRPDD